MTNTVNAAEFLAPFHQNIASIEAALSVVEFGFVNVWPQYGLGVALKDGKSYVLSAEKATIFRTEAQAKANTFTNGKGEQAEVMSVYDARVAALDLARANLKDMEAVISANQ